MEIVDVKKNSILEALESKGTRIWYEHWATGDASL